MGAIGMAKSIAKGLAYSTKLYRGDMDPLARVVATFISKPDRTPVFAQMHDHAMYLAGVSAREFYTDAQLHLDVIRSVSQYYGFDVPIAIGDVYNIEVEALGAKMIYGDHSMPTVDFTEPLIKEPKDLLKLKSPNPLRDGRMPYSLELARSQGVGLFCAPFSLAVAMRTYPKLIRDMRRDPTFANDLFAFIVDEVLTPYIKAMRKESGVRMAAGADAWSAFPNMTPEMGEQWVLPYAHKLRRAGYRAGVYTSVVASLDYCEERPEHFDNDIIKRCFDVEAKAAGIPVAAMGMGRWQDVDIRVVREWADSKVRLLNTVPIVAGVNARVLHDGPASEIVEVVKQYVDLLGRKGRFVGFLSNISADTPSDHVHAAVAAFHQYGKYPIAEDLDEIEFRMPVIEPYLGHMKIPVAG
ncbi:MAG: uroporphyrinogen decarboxylase family protein [Chloroflexota bacterium]|nr:uroporphyrinogen decarboxylase family protein [Chloroflexota bacterium]